MQEPLTSTKYCLHWNIQHNPSRAARRSPHARHDCALRLLNPAESTVICGTLRSIEIWLVPTQKQWSTTNRPIIFPISHDGSHQFPSHDDRSSWNVRYCTISRFPFARHLKSRRSPSDAPRAPSSLPSKVDVFRSGPIPNFRGPPSLLTLFLPFSGRGDYSSYTLRLAATASHLNQLLLLRRRLRLRLRLLLVCSRPSMIQVRCQL